MSTPPVEKIQTRTQQVLGAQLLVLATLALIIGGCFALGFYTALLVRVVRWGWALGWAL